MRWDVFISYAHEDRHAFVQALVDALVRANISVWYDNLSLNAGEHLRESIERGIRDSRIGLVVMSPPYLKNVWTRRELDTILDEEIARKTNLLIPVWHGVDETDVAQFSTRVSLRAAVPTGDGPAPVVTAVLKALGSTEVPVISAVQHPFKWWSHRTGTPQNLTGISVGADGVWFATGNAGLLLRSADRGRTWSECVTTHAALRCVAFDGSRTSGWAAGDNGAALYTRDGGVSWEPRAIVGLGDITSAAWCANDRCVCFTLENGSVVHYDGATATPIDTRSDYLWQIRFDAQGEVGCVVGADGRVLVSMDAGRTWAESAWPNSSHIYGCAVTNNRTMWAVGDGGTVCMSPDAGGTWRAVTLFPDASFWDTWLNTCSFSPTGQRGIIAGAQGALAASRDGGATWTVGKLQDRTELVNVEFADEETVIGVGYSGVAMSGQP